MHTRISALLTEALAKEVLRWNAVVPTGSCSMIRRHANPSQFNPERFLAKDGKGSEIDPRLICFGFGRRICIGRHLADASVVENSVEITPEIDPSSGTISHPKPFKCSIKARSAKAIGLIQQDANY
ncbi:cytochrome P450 [Suillus lakei]|nr:cytochrome P450 [Suillus lakei]